MPFSFKFKPLPSITFGLGCLQNLAEIVYLIGSKFLVVTGNSFFERVEGWEKIENKMRSSGKVLFFAKVSAEPTPQLIDAIVAQFHREKLDGVIAIGGGSVLDGGKAIAAMLPAAEPVEQFLEGIGSREPDGSKVPFVAVPTTAGTGSEVSANAVITRPGPEGYKKSLRHDRYIPDQALLDPELMRSCPPPLTAACSMDAFTQLVEGFLSTESSPFTDALAWSGIEAVKRSLLRVYRDGDDIKARSDMAYAALCSGIVLANAGLGIIHGIAPALGARFSMPHGLVCGTLMAAGNDITLSRLADRDREDDTYRCTMAKYERLDALFLPEGSGSKNIGAGFVEELYRLTELLELPKLSEYGVASEDVDGIAGRSANKNNPAALSKSDIRTVLLKRL